MGGKQRVFKMEIMRALIVFSFFVFLSCKSHRLNDEEFSESRVLEYVLKSQEVSGLFEVPLKSGEFDLTSRVKGGGRIYIYDTLLSFTEFELDTLHLLQAGLTTGIMEDLFNLPSKKISDELEEVSLVTDKVSFEEERKPYLIFSRVFFDKEKAILLIDYKCFMCGFLELVVITKNNEGELNVFSRNYINME